MGFFSWLFGLGKNKGNNNATNKSGVGFSLGSPDPRTPEQIEFIKKKYLHRDAQPFSGGICAKGQADGERMIIQYGNILKGVIYTCALDNACCPKCWPLDGMVFECDIGKRPPIPRHENCRCLYLPKAKTWRDFGIDVDELPPVERPWVLADYQYTYKRNPNKKLKNPRRTIRECGKFQGTAEEWIKSLPEHEQRQFFPSDISYELWKSKKIKAIDLLDPNTWEIRSDKELERLFS